MRIIWMPYSLGNRSFRTEWVYWSQRTCEGICGKGIEVAICIRFRNNVGREDVGEHTVLCLVLKLMCTLHPRVSIVHRKQSPVNRQSLVELTYPIPLEAILAAEKRLFAQFLAGGTLQAASIFIAVGALAFARLLDGRFFRWCLVHRCRCRG